MMTRRFSVALAIVALAVACATGNSDAAIPASERNALIDLYNDTTGASWTHRDNWRNPGDTDFNDPGTECTWYGVTCDTAGDHVTTISLKTNNLDGSLPASIGDFSSLAILELLGNSNLTGSIPASIGNLAALQVLNAYDGSLTGSIPPEIGNLTNLNWLELSQNQLTDAIPSTIGNLASLTDLDLDSNQLTGSIPPEIGNLANLQILRIPSNTLSGSIPPEIGNLSNLKTLVLYENQLADPLPPEIGDLTNLRTLDLANNDLTGSIPTEIGDMTDLYSLNLSLNTFHGSIPSSISGLKNLRTLSLGENSLSGSIPPEIGELEALRNLNLSGNLFEGPIPDEIVRLVNLYDGWGLKLSYNALYTHSHAVDAFVDQKSLSSGDWAATQTVAPTDVSVGAVTNTTVELKWTPIDFTSETGGYNAWYALSSGGPYTVVAATADKSADSITVIGLSPLVNYYFYVDAVTNPHSYNPNTVVSQPGLEVSTRTFSGSGPTLSIGDATVVEGDSGTVQAVFTVSLFPASGGPVTVTVATGNGTALAGEDYVSASIPLVFAPGETSKTAAVTVNGDLLVEGDETFFGILGGGSGALAGRSVATATIADDDTGLVGHERQALIDLYNSTNGAGWFTRTNWRNPGDTDFNDPGTECTWYGVSCDLTGQRVQSINLTGNNLTGSLPASIGDFTALDLFVLTENDIGGDIPAEVGTMAALTHLDLAYAGVMTGSIPPEIGKLSNLTHLYLYDLGLSGEIPVELGDLESLSRLDLRLNQLTGSIPSQVGELVNLQRLDLSANQLSDQIPAEIGDLSSLESLRLHSNQLSGAIPPEIGQLSNLTRLYLHSNQLAGSIPIEITTLPLLTLLLSQNQLSGPLPPELGDFTAISVLELAGNQFSGTIPPQLGNLLTLSRLELRQNSLTGNIPPELGSLSNLWRLDLGENHLSGEIPPELGDLSNLNYLYLDSNRLTGSPPTDITDLSSLQDMTGLDLRWNGFHSDDVFLSAFLNLKHSSHGDWRDTQTVPPGNLVVTSVDDHTAWLSWDAVDYTDDEGGYEIFVTPTGTETWASGGWTSDKSQTMFPMTVLDPATTYDLAVVSFTDPHSNNQNLVISDLSGIEMATTSDLGCPQPEIFVDYGGDTILSVPGSFTSFLWSTGESSATVIVDPPEPTWYWVTVTSSGGCEDSAAKLVLDLFGDGFETGDTSAWTYVAP
jgi:Leucine-rich repeat (LRR) protein